MTHVEKLTNSLTAKIIREEIKKCYDLGVEGYLIDARNTLKKETGEGTKAAKTYYLLENGKYLPMKAIGRMAQIRGGKTQENYNSITFAAAMENHCFEIFRNPSLRLSSKANSKARVERERTYYWGLSRPGQAKFRREVLKRFGKKCILSSCKVLEAIEAAHLIPVSENGNDDVSNGIPLRRDIHRLFDYHYIAIKPYQHTVHLDKSIRDEYRRQVSNKALLPSSMNIEAALEIRWKIFNG